jgi:hypothetical protein
MMALGWVLVGVLAVVVLLGATVWIRHHRARRDLEGHFLHEWDERERWADLTEETSASEDRRSESA